MRKGESSHAVRLIQQSMIDLGVSRMAVSTRNYGSPDGIYGAETRLAVASYQSNNALSSDGVVGQNTMQCLDVDLPNASPTLPSLPARSRYMVPGSKVTYNQLAKQHTNLCWAYAYAMMLSWKRHESYADVRDVVAGVGAQYVSIYDNNRVMPYPRVDAFLRAAGLRGQPLQCFPVSTWSDMLRRHGLLYIGALSAPGTAGGHARVLYGVSGDGNPSSTNMLVMDPWGGVKYGESFERFTAVYEGAASSGMKIQIANF